MSAEEEEDLDIRVQPIYWAIIDRKGGKKAFTKDQLDVALRVADEICAGANTQPKKLEVLLSLLPPDVVQQQQGKPLPFLRDDATFKEAQALWLELMKDGKDESGNPGGPFKYDYSGSDKAPEYERDQLKTRLKAAQRRGVEVSEEMVQNAVIANDLFGQEDVEYLLGIEEEQTGFVPPTPAQIEAPAAPRKVQRIPSKRKQETQEDPDPDPVQEDPAKRPPVDLAPFKKRIRAFDPTAWEEAENVLNYDQYDELNNWVKTENEWIEYNNKKIRERRAEEERQAYLQTMPMQEFEINDSYARARANRRGGVVFMTRGDER